LVKQKKLAELCECNIGMARGHRATLTWAQDFQQCLMMILVHFVLTGVGGRP